MRTLLLLCGCLAISLLAGPTLAAPVDFARQVQPILAGKCMKCHGPDKATAGLAFNTRERALGKTDSGEPAIVPGKPEESGLLSRVTSHDESLRMPPEGKPVTEAETSILKQWIAEGANWSEHWAFRPVVKPTPPEVKNQTWSHNEIDRFILAGLEAKSLAPNGPASKRVLVRRAYFDLVGLPPTVEEVEAFVNDTSPQAWEKLIDKLLASPHYGEQWARKWFDVVRFAETNSFERDGAKPHAWRYRDYVIRSLNSDKPYDAFLREQLAGDEFLTPTPDSLTATGFYRLGVWDDEPADRELAMYDGFDDLVTTIGQGMLGLTFNCCRCHNHKIDPLTQADYYQLVSFVRNIVPMASGGENIEQQIFTSTADEEKYHAAVRDQQDELAQAEAEVKRLEDIFLLMTTGEDKEVGHDFAAVKYKLYRRSFDVLPDFASLKPNAVGELKSKLIDISPTPRNTEFAFLFDAELKVPTSGEYTFYLDSDDGSRLILNDRELMKYDGIHGEGNEHTAKINLEAGTTKLQLEYFQRHHGLGLTLAWSGPGFNRRPLSRPYSPDDRRKASGDKLAKQMKERGLAVLGVDEFAKYQEAFKLREELKKEIPVEKALVVKERSADGIPDVFVLLRGTPGNHGDKVTPGFPQVLSTGQPLTIQPAAKGKSSGRRTALAEWIASRENRLTARVFVNRVWQGHFGRGIVRSPNNFGVNGSPPTHPELLDWLAVEFMEGGWKIKRLHKLIMMSNAYQMSSAANEEALGKDPANDSFWRYDMRRLSAEELRDATLATTGSLNRDMFGPSVYPEIQAEVLAGQSVPGKGWGKSSPEQQNRRSVYVHVKRSLLLPFLASFDFPETDISCEARFTTTQPGQAFTLLNGKFANDQATLFAQRFTAAAKSDRPSDRIRAAYRLALCREPSDGERERAEQLITKLRNEHGLTAELAWAQFGLYMLNLNEFAYLE